MGFKKSKLHKKYKNIQFKAIKSNNIDLNKKIQKMWDTLKANELVNKWCLEKPIEKFKKVQPTIIKPNDISLNKKKNLDGCVLEQKQIEWPIKSI